jgi:vacuolar iron transporter family protein
VEPDVQPGPAEIERRQRYLENLSAERDNAAIYRALSGAVQDSGLAAVYARLAAAEEKHAALWAERLRAIGADVPAERPSRRGRVLAWLARRFGPSFVLPTMAVSVDANRWAYDRQPEATDEMRGDERAHARLLAELANTAPRGIAGSALARLEGRHRAVGGNALRAAVLGANDGLVSNLSLVMGVAGADLSSRAILITGVAGLLAGACSMAIGEWISVTSSRELYERQLAIERDEIATFPDAEREELSLLYQAKGLAKGDADRVAGRLIADDLAALDTMAREELGLDPQGLGGSPWVAAFSSFVPFVLGALVPVIPFTFLDGNIAVATSVAASAAALFLIGAAITLVTGRSVAYSGIRQVALGLAAAAITYGIGALVGVSVSG